MKVIKFIRNFWFGGFILLLAFAVNAAAQVVREGTGSNASGLAATVDQFKADLGGGNNGNGASYRDGYRQIDWEDLPDGVSSQNIYERYNSAHPRGIILSPSRYVGSQAPFEYSRTNFQSYNPGFQSFSGNTTFSPLDDTRLDIGFTIPGTKIPASVNGFGIVFSDIDYLGSTLINLYDEKGKLIETYYPKKLNNGLTFFGISFTDGTRIARASIQVGNRRLSEIFTEGDQNNAPATSDKVVLDDIIFSEPHAIGYHKGDFDGDGTADLVVFRPSEGVWYIQDSGTHNVAQVPFGTAGDIPMDGDFDGDARSDFAIFRPSTGTWWILKSADLSVQSVQFGAGGDKPVPGDYDKDGKTDYAVFHDGVYLILQSSTGEVVKRQFGLSGDLPVGTVQ